MTLQNVSNLWFMLASLLSPGYSFSWDDDEDEDTDWEADSFGPEYSAADEEEE